MNTLTSWVRWGGRDDGVTPTELTRESEEQMDLLGTGWREWVC